MKESTIKELINQAGWYKPVNLPSDWDEDDYIVNKQQAMDFAELVINFWIRKHRIQPANPRSEVRYEEALRDHNRNVERIIQALVTTKT